MKYRKREAQLALAAGVLASIAVTPAEAQTVEQFYQGKQVTLLAPSVTGGNGIYARTLARYMGRYIPGRPSIVAQAMPSAAGVGIMNNIYSVAAKDGLTFGTVDRSALMEPLLGNSNAKFDASKMTSIASIGKQIVVCSVAARSKIKTINQAMEEEVLVGAQTASDALASYPKLVNTVLHTKFKVITGYDGTQAIWLAMERGEVDGACGAWSTLKTDRPDWITNHEIRPLLQVSFGSHPELPNVPTLANFKTSETEREMLEFYASPDVIGRPYLAPPGIPEDRKIAMRRAFDATMKDADFMDEARRLNIEIDPVGGEHMETLLRDIYATPPDIVQRLIQLRGGQSDSH